LTLHLIYLLSCSSTPLKLFSRIVRRQTPQSLLTCLLTRCGIMQHNQKETLKSKVTAESLPSDTIEAGPIDLAALSASMLPSQPCSVVWRRVRKCETRSRSESDENVHTDRRGPREELKWKSGDLPKTQFQSTFLSYASTVTADWVFASPSNVSVFPSGTNAYLGISAIFSSGLISLSS
jgi:hypothetical protein